MVRPIDDAEGKVETQIVLGLDTSSPLTSIAICKGAEVALSWTGELSETRSERLWVELDSRIRSIGVSLGDIDLFSVCVGPGSFTGLRVGIAAVSGLAWSLKKPTVGVTALEAAAFGASPAAAVCAMVNAYRGEIYWQLFGFNIDGSPLQLSEPAVTTLQVAMEKVGDIESLVFAGDASLQYRDSIVTLAGDRFTGQPRPGNEQKGWSVAERSDSPAAAIARLAVIKASRGEAQDAEQLRACYVRPSDAEVKLALGLLGSKLKRALKAD
jgi:tRNA threonylcarbamoyladenosine biosynthesis protein TsaB